MSKYQALIDALKAGPTDGPWEFGSYAGCQIRIGPNGKSKHCAFALMTGRASFPWDDTEESRDAFNNAAYITAANPAVIRSLLADLEMAEKALDAIFNSAEAGNAAIIEHLLSDARSALSQLNGKQ